MFSRFISFCFKSQYSIFAAWDKCMRVKKVIILSLLGITAIFSLGQQRMDDTAALHGRVTDLFGQSLQNGSFGVQLDSDAPVPKAELKFYLLDVTENERKAVVEAKAIKSVFTDKDGNYNVSGLPAGEYRVQIYIPGYSVTNDWFLYLSKGTIKTLDMGVPVGNTHFLSQVIISGVVKDGNHAPLQDATVTLLNAFNRQEMWQERTDNLGRYKFDTMQPGQYIIYASKPGLEVKADAIVLARGQNPRDFELSPLLPLK
jgi:Carboxypeptidase regulatory-like domain